jgi:hypothetical protein
MPTINSTPATMAAMIGTLLLRRPVLDGCVTGQPSPVAMTGITASTGRRRHRSCADPLGGPVRIIVPGTTGHNDEFSTDRTVSPAI